MRYNGASWAENYIGGDVTLRGIHVISSAAAWAVGSDGTALHYDGSNWSALASSTKNYLNAVSASPDGSVGAIGGDTGMLAMHGRVRQVFLPIILHQPTPMPTPTHTATNTPPPTNTPVPTSTPIPGDALGKAFF